MGAHRHNPFARHNIVDASKLHVRDAHGRELCVGDHVVMPELTLPHLQVAKIAPNLDPAAPPGTMQVIVRMQMALIVPANQPVQNLLLIRTVEELTAQYGEQVRPTESAPAASPAEPPPGPSLVTES